MHTEKQIRPSIQDLEQRAKVRKQLFDGKIHPAETNNEFFSTIRDKVYEQIVKEES